jgi:hypothetical protein
MESQFGIAHVWTQGDFVMRSVAIMLLVMSVASWAGHHQGPGLGEVQEVRPPGQGLLAQRRLAPA